MKGRGRGRGKGGKAEMRGTTNQPYGIEKSRAPTCVLKTASPIPKNTASMKNTMERKRGRGNEKKRYYRSEMKQKE